MGSGDYTWFGIEKPFPWVGITLFTVAGAATGLALVYLALIFGNDQLVDF